MYMNKFIQYKTLTRLACQLCTQTQQCTSQPSSTHTQLGKLILKGNKKSIL